MLGIGAGELIVIGVLALLVVGPEKLPIMIRDVVRWVRDLRRLVESTRRDISEQVGPELRDLGLDELRELRDLDPRHFVRRNILEGIDDEPPARSGRNGAGGSARSARSANGAGDGAAANGAGAGGRAGARARTSRRADAAPSYDPDTT